MANLFDQNAGTAVIRRVITVSAGRPEMVAQMNEPGSNHIDQESDPSALDRLGGLPDKTSDGFESEYISGLRHQTLSMFDITIVLLGAVFVAFAIFGGARDLASTSRSPNHPSAQPPYEMENSRSTEDRLWPHSEREGY